MFREVDHNRQSYLFCIILEKLLFLLQSSYFFGIVYPHRRGRGRGADAVLRGTYRPRIGAAGFVHLVGVALPGDLCGFDGKNCGRRDLRRRASGERAAVGVGADGPQRCAHGRRRRAAAAAVR